MQFYFDPPFCNGLRHEILFHLDKYEKYECVILLRNVLTIVFTSIQQIFAFAKNH